MAAVSRSADIQIAAVKDGLGRTETIMTGKKRSARTRGKVGIEVVLPARLLSPCQPRLWRLNR